DHDTVLPPVNSIGEGEDTVRVDQQWNPAGGKRLKKANREVAGAANTKRVISVEDVRDESLARPTYKLCVTFCTEHAAKIVFQRQENAVHSSRSAQHSERPVADPVAKSLLAFSRQDADELLVSRRNVAAKPNGRERAFVTNLRPTTAVCEHVVA